MPSWSSERGCRSFPFSEIKKATDSFTNYLGRGGEGVVFKGVLKDGNHVAVKRLNPNLSQDDYDKEIDLLSGLHHTNLVSLRGFCQTSDQKFLVYEFMSNGSLADNLYRKPPGFILSWEQRLNISIGAARGLEYLHTGTSYTHKIIHRDVKPANILLGSNWEAKVSDFGLSKRGPANQEHSSLCVPHIQGTFGFIAPEYTSSGKITSRVDVFAFGVVLFELLCKKRPWGYDDSSLNEGGHRGNTTLAEWAERNVDPDLKGVISQSCLEAFIEIAERCVNRDMEQCPCMNEVIARLNYALRLQKRNFETVKSADSEKHNTSDKNNSPANREKRQVDSGSTKPLGCGFDKRSLQHADLKRSKSAKFEKSSQTENNKSMKQESTVASTKEVVVHSTRATSEKRKPRKEITQASSSSGVSIKLDSGDSKSFSRGWEAATKEEDSTKSSDSKEVLSTNSSADIPGTEDKVVLYVSYTGEGSSDYMKTKFYLKRFCVDIDKRDPVVNPEYKPELGRFLAKKQKEFSLPQLFIGGRYIGGAKEVEDLYYSGELGTCLEVCQH